MRRNPPSSLCQQHRGPLQRSRRGDVSQFGHYPTQCDNGSCSRLLGSGRHGRTAQQQHLLLGHVSERPGIVCPRAGWKQHDFHLQKELQQQKILAGMPLEETVKEESNTGAASMGLGKPVGVVPPSRNCGPA